MQKLNFFFAIVLITGLMAAGCVGTPAPATSTETPTPQIIYVTVTVTVTPTETGTAAPATTPATTVTTSAHETLYHRWVNTTSSSETGAAEGKEIRIYPDGSLTMKIGTVNEVSSNIVIKNVSEMWVGTWTSVGDDMYLGKISLSGATSATPEAIEIRYYPEGTDARFPGFVAAERIVTDEIVYFRAKTD